MFVYFLALVAVAAASDGYTSRSYHETHTQVYQGRYNGQCNHDGVYYNDENSIMLCSNGNAYHQPCAPGSRNLDARSYNPGRHYGVADFCGVNLVDFGYNDNSGSTGYGPSYRPHPHPHRQEGYGEPHPSNRGYGPIHDDSYGPSDGYSREMNSGYGDHPPRRVHGDRRPHGH